MAKKEFFDTKREPDGTPPHGEMYWWEPGRQPNIRAVDGNSTPRWRIYLKHSPGPGGKYGWQDYTGTDPVSDDGQILKSGQYISFQSYSGVYKIDFADADHVNVNADVTFTNDPVIDKHGCQCGVWKSGGIHAGYCDRAGQSDPGEAYL